MECIWETEQSDGMHVILNWEASVGLTKNVIFEQIPKFTKIHICRYTGEKSSMQQNRQERPWWEQSWCGLGTARRPEHEWRLEQRVKKES